MERTFKFRQSDIVKHVDSLSAEKAFSLQLDTFGPYDFNYTRNGRHLLLGGRKGHLATFDWRTAKLGCEFHVKETVRDVQWLHNEMMFAVAQKKYVYIYDHTGMEIHCMQNHIDVNRMEFLPYHFLLATVGGAGYLRYHDTSTGNLVAELRTRLGSCDTMVQNPNNAIMHLGHTNGTVTLWSPNMTQPLVKMLCHKGPVNAIAIDQRGHYMATSGLDGKLRIWDNRTYKPLQEYYTPTPVTCLNISQRGLLAAGHGPRVSIFKDALTCSNPVPYMTHLEPSQRVQTVQFCPFEDVLGVSHTGGFTSLLVPGSGEPNYDAMELNPYQNRKQRQEAEVKSLLDKIQPQMICLNPEEIGRVDRFKEQPAVEKKEDDQNGKQEGAPEKRKMRGRSTAMRRYLKKQQNVIDGKKELLKQKLEKERKERDHERRRQRGEVVSDDDRPTYGVLDRFKLKSKK